MSDYQELKFNNFDEASKAYSGLLKSYQNIYGQNKELKKENQELKEVVDELSKCMSAISDLASHMKLASTLFVLKQGKITIPTGEKYDDK